MNVGTRGMRTVLAAASLLAAVLWSMAGCGGSGSSGFDISEAQIVANAIDLQACVEFQQRNYCASGVAAPTGDFPGASITIVVPADPVTCEGEPVVEDGAPAKACTASLEVTTEGFSHPNSLLAAVSETEIGPWTLAQLTVTEDVTGPRNVEIHVPAGPDGSTLKPLIAAVLVYEGAAPENVPQEREHLAGFGANLVYVSQRLEIVIPR